MKRFLVWLTILLLLSAGGYFGYRQAAAWLAARNRPQFRTAAVERGDILAVDDTTGRQSVTVISPPLMLARPR